MKKNTKSNEKNSKNQTLLKGYHKSTPYTDADPQNPNLDYGFKKIERSLGGKIKLSKEHKSMLNTARMKWETCEELLPKRIPSSDQIRENKRIKIDNLKNKIAELITLLETDGHLIESLSHDRLMNKLYMALRFAESAQTKEGKPTKEKLPKKQGNPGDIYWKYFILDLMRIFEAITGKAPERPYYKDIDEVYEKKDFFVDFVKACVKPIIKIKDNTLTRSILNTMKSLPDAEHTSAIFKTGPPNKNQIFPEKQ